MSIKHKFIKTNFGNDFQTNNAILSEITYCPEILILGTFNPNTPKTNYADFFYGRNYFWTGFKNLFIENGIVLNSSRMPKNGRPKNKLNPELSEIKDLCLKLKLTFADLILEVLQKQDSNYKILENDNIIFQNKIYNLIQDDKKGQILGLAQLDKLGQVNWNTNNIIKYLCDNPTIKTIYFTRQAKGVWHEQWKKIEQHERLKDRIFTNIFTPSGQGSPVLNSMQRLLNHWVHNENPNFGKFDSNWLTNKGVNLNKF